ncbi:MAG: transposase [Candidatus Cloacimonetes bacterium]|nr:transposase [Candidatus Cloacimonadota bacterium]MBL7149084.1 transposase [Candidatus Cloacimonadota bacterium]
MPSPRISQELKNEIYFVTLTIQKWYYLFDRHDRWEILLKALRYYQKNNDLKIYAWVFMINHIHLIFQIEDSVDFLRSFKSYTSHQLKDDLLLTEPDVLRLFKFKDGYHIWRNKNFPELIQTEDFFYQKVKYVEENPVKKSYVYNPEDWKYSSANVIQLLNVTRFE